ncbi:MAG: hypothetical protein WBA12_11010 [Catalinimonas sp.]
MEDLEYEIIDALYFVTGHRALANEVGVDEQTLQPALRGLIERGWVRQVPGPPVGEAQHTEPHYLATKAGLLHHNGMDT